MHSGGRTTITDYSMANKDKVSLASGGMGDVSGVTVGGSGGVTLTFGSDDDLTTIDLANIATTDTVTFQSARDTYGTGYVFENDKVRTASGRGVTLTTNENDVYTVGVNNSAEVTVIANNGGTITGGTQNATLGGKDVNIVAGTGKEVFLYKGGSMNIVNYTTSDNVSLASGYTVTGNKLDKEKNTFTLTVDDGTDTPKNITFEGAESNAFNSVNVNVNGINQTIIIPYSDVLMIFDQSNPVGSTKVTVNTETADFGVLGSASGISDGQLVVNGEEYYAGIADITALKENSHIVGNSKANTFYIAGGANNILTGGIKTDTFIFESGGGVITDFGIGTTKNGANKYLATTTKRTDTSTYVGYNRDDPLSYAQGIDILNVDGTVVEIAFRQNSANYDSSTESTFTAYVTYFAGGNYSTIALANIHKKAITTDKAGGGAGAVYTTNLEQMQGSYTKNDGTTATCTSPNIWDTSTGTSAKLTGTTWTSLFVDKSNSAFSSNIARLDALIQARGITTYSEDGKIASVSNGIVAAYAAQQGGTS